LHVCCKGDANLEAEMVAASAGCEVGEEDEQIFDAEEALGALRSKSVVSQLYLHHEFSLLRIFVDAGSVQPCSGRGETTPASSHWSRSE
jgi:hypothetical protein